VTSYPEWIYYPPHVRPPEWVPPFLAAVAAAQSSIDSHSVESLTSDLVLAQLRPGLQALGYEVEAGKQRDQKIRRPVLFGEQGHERVAYEVDAVHDELGVVVEVEAGRGARGNAVYRDLVRTSLIVGARFLALGVISEYRRTSRALTLKISARPLVGLTNAVPQVSFRIEKRCPCHVDIHFPPKATSSPVVGWLKAGRRQGVRSTRTAMRKRAVVAAVVLSLAVTGGAVVRVIAINKPAVVVILIPALAGALLAIWRRGAIVGVSPPFSPPSPRRSV
jgi:hypothetical protein